LHGLARALRSEWAGKVGVQVVHPGPTRTPMHEKAGFDPGRLAALFLDPRDVAAMIASAMASRHSPVTINWLRYFGGGSVLGRRL
jgi:short-subunit dehydrogenase